MNYKRLISIALISLVAVVGVAVGVNNVAAQSAGGEKDFTFEQVIALLCLSGIDRACPAPESEEVSLGAQSGPDVFSAVECHNGVCEQNERVAFTSTSSVPWFVELKLKATSSIERVSCDIQGNGIGALTFDISTTSRATAVYSGSETNGSSTPALVYGRALGEQAKDQFVWDGVSVNATSSDQSLGHGLVFTVSSVTDGTSIPVQIVPGEVLKFTIATGTGAVAPGPSVADSFITGACSTLFRDL